MGCIQATEKTSKTPIRSAGNVKDNKIPEEITLASNEQKEKAIERDEQKD